MSSLNPRGPITISLSEDLVMNISLEALNTNDLNAGVQYVPVYFVKLLYKNECSSIAVLYLSLQKLKLTFYHDHLF